MGNVERGERNLSFSNLHKIAHAPHRLEIQGMPASLLEDAAVSQYLNGGGQFDFSGAPSGHGTLVYLAGKVEAQTWPVVWLDSSGKLQPLNAVPGFYSQPRFSPDERRLALTMRTSSGPDIYVYELGRETMTRLTFGGHAQQPVWTPDGKHITFQWSAKGFGIGWVRSDGSGEPQQILASPNVTNPYSFSPDGRHLAYYEKNLETDFDIWTVTLDTSDPDQPKLDKPELFQEPHRKCWHRCSRPTDDGSRIGPTNREETRSMCALSPAGGPASGRSRPEAARIQCGPTMAGNCFTRGRTTASWWWTIR